MSRSVSLIGFMGAGKTTVGQRLAGQLSLQFIDLDTQIERQAKTSIAEIFEKDGEEAFRELETDTLNEVLRGEPCVLAAGGGTPTRDVNRLQLRQQTRVVWLDIRIETARKRLGEGDPPVRPLLAQMGWEGLSRLLDQRRRDYSACAHFRVESDGRAPGELSRSISRLLAADQSA